MAGSTRLRVLGMAVVAVIAAGSVVSSGAVPAASAPPAGAVMTASATSGRPGDTITVTTTGCERTDEEIYRYTWVRLVTTGPDPVLVAVGQSYSDEPSVRLTLPDWYDAAQPAQLVAQCQEQDFETGSMITVFDYTPLAFDLLAGTGPSIQQMTMSGSTFAEGQVIPIALSGCITEGDEQMAEVVLIKGGDRTVSGEPEVVAFAEPSSHGVDGSVELELAVVGYEPIEAGPYLVLGLCYTPDGFINYEPSVIEVRGSNPVHSLTAEGPDDSDEVVAAGEGCTGGRLVTVEFVPGLHEGIEDETRTGRDGARRPSLPRAFSSSPSTARAGATRDHAPLDSLTVTPDADGSWAVTWTAPGGVGPLLVTADCGDPVGEGFRYQYVRLFGDVGGFVFAERISPTSSPVGDPVTVHLSGECDAEVVASIALPGQEPATSGSTELVDGIGSVSLRAPADPGSYELEVACDGRAFEMGMTYEIWEPGAPESPETVPAPPPGAGWPSAGPVESYAGRIGPIWLPPESGEGEQPAGMLSPSELFIDVPRPAGDFAIRSMAYNLVDEHDVAVPKGEAHLHHFVIANESAQNPACPNGTFGLPGEIISAVGEERTETVFDDPYGLVVRADDDWSGVYELMPMADEGRVVYLTYDFTLQRDLTAIRPLTSYFASATGCNSFTWTVNGSGEPDVQSHYMSVKNDGLLVGGGGHAHNGGEATELYDDRGRLLCRAEVHFGTEGGHAEHDGRSRARAEAVTATTVVEEEEEEEEDWDYPPEFYPDDPSIEHISTCPSINQPVTAGERLRFDAIYTNDRPRSGVMGIALFYVWEGGGPVDPATGTPVDPSTGLPQVPTAPPAQPIPGTADFTG